MSEAASTFRQYVTEAGPPRATKAEGRRELEDDQIRLLEGPTGRLAERGLDVLRRTRLLWRVNFTVRGQWLGTPIAIPIVYGNGIQHIRSGERWMYEVLRRLMRLSSGAFVDVGANLGQTLLKVKMLDRDREYYAFEPNPEAVFYLQHLVGRNGFGGTRIFPIGLSDAPRVVTMFSKADADPSASIVEGFRPLDRYCRAQAVAVQRGDDVFGNGDGRPIGLIKIDVEGAELDVLNGLRRTVVRHQPVILCEVLPVYDPATEAGRLRHSRQTALWALLRSMGYAVYRLNRGASAERVEGFGVHSDLSRSNYLFLPSSVDPASAFDQRS